MVIENNSGDTYLKGVFADTLDTANVIFDKDYGVEIDGQKKLFRRQSRLNNQVFLLYETYAVASSAIVTVTNVR